MFTKIDKLISIFKIAYRNIWRNKRRSLITFSSIIFGCAALILAGGYIHYTFYGLSEQTIHSELGHMQFYQQGYLENSNTNPYRYLIHDTQYSQLASLLKNNPKIQVFTKRIEFMGLISTSEKSIAFLGLGIEPEKEKLIGTFIHLIQGRLLTDTEQDRYSIVIGRNLAQSLGVTVNDSVTLLTTTVQGSMNAIDFTIVGIFSTGIKEYDERAIRIHLSTAQSLLNTNQIGKVVVGLYRTEDTDFVFNDLQKKTGTLQLSLLKWIELAQYYQGVVNLFNDFFHFFQLIIFIIVTLSISNTLTMSVMERIIEIGTMRAIGTSKRNVILLFTCEGILIGVIGGIFGILFGIILAKVVNFFGGIPMSAPPGFTEGYSIFILLVPKVLLTAFTVSVVAAVISTFIPAYRASKMKIVDALGHV